MNDGIERTRSSLWIILDAFHCGHEMGQLCFLVFLHVPNVPFFAVTMWLYVMLCAIASHLGTLIKSETGLQNSGRGFHMLFNVLKQ